MTKLRIRKIAIFFAAAVLFLIAYLFYSRPMTISQLYPMLTLDKCTKIQGYYEIGMQTKPTKFTAEKGSEEFEQLCELLFQQRYRRTLRDLLPRGTRTPRTEPEDFQWDVHFYFEDIEFPDGSRGSGAMLRLQNWYGALDIYFDGDTRSCRTSEQDAWAKNVLDIMQ